MALTDLEIVELSIRRAADRLSPGEAREGLKDAADNIYLLMRERRNIRYQKQKDYLTEDDKL